MPHITLNTHDVYTMMIGMNIIVETSIIISVSWLLDASKTVKLWLGLLEDGIRNGNMLTPAVLTMPNMLAPLLTNASIGFFDPTKRVVRTAPAKPSNGARRGGPGKLDGAIDGFSA